MSSILNSVFFFIIAIGVLVTIHEFGHFWVARRLGVKVLKFSVGFGKPILKWRRKNDETEYVISAIPLGGYVQMLDEREGTVENFELDRAFNRQKLSTRIAIVSAGPIFNFILAFILYWIIFIIGVAGLKPFVGEVKSDSIAQKSQLKTGDLIVKIGGQATPTWNSVLVALLDKSLSPNHVNIEVLADGDVLQKTLDFGATKTGIDRSNLLSSIGIKPMRPKGEPVIEFVSPNNPAEKSGLLQGDKILKTDGLFFDDTEAWIGYIRNHPKQKIALEVERNREIVNLEIVPDAMAGKTGDVGKIGASIRIDQALIEPFQTVERYSFFAAAWLAVKKTWQMSTLTFKMLWKMVVGEVSVSNISGPISIAQYAGTSASLGLVAFLGYLALISVSLGVLNLLPIPLLDGGHLLYYLVEWIKGSPVSEATQMIGQRLGFSMLAVILIVAFYNDLARIFG